MSTSLCGFTKNGGWFLEHAEKVRRQQTIRFELGPLAATLRLLDPTGALPLSRANQAYHDTRAFVDMGYIGSALRDSGFADIGYFVGMHVDERMTTVELNPVEFREAIDVELLPRRPAVAPHIFTFTSQWALGGPIPRYGINRPSEEIFAERCAQLAAPRGVVVRFANHGVITVAIGYPGPREAAVRLPDPYSIRQHGSSFNHLCTIIILLSVILYLLFIH